MSSIVIGMRRGIPEVIAASQDMSVYFINWDDYDYYFNVNGGRGDVTGFIEQVIKDKHNPQEIKRGDFEQFIQDYIKKEA